MQLPIQKMETA